MRQPFRPLSALLAAAMLTVPAISAAADAKTVQFEGQQWTLTTNGDDLPWADADQYCRELELEGHQDWRLPTLVELEALHDPATEGGIVAPISLDACCIWSATSLADRSADQGGDTAGDPALYYWGFLFEGGTRYYSFQRFADGRALCMRDVDEMSSSGMAAGRVHQ